MLNLPAGLYWCHSCDVRPVNSWSSTVSFDAFMRIEVNHW